MRFPSWFTFLLAALVALFGLYRIRLGLLSPERYESMRQRGSMYRVSRRNHILVGIVYLCLGGWLVASAFGYTVW